MTGRLAPDLYFYSSELADSLTNTTTTTYPIRVESCLINPVCLLSAVGTVKVRECRFLCVWAHSVHYYPSSLSVCIWVKWWTWAGWWEGSDATTEKRFRVRGCVLLTGHKWVWRQQINRVVSIMLAMGIVLESMSNHLFTKNRKKKDILFWFMSSNHRIFVPAWPMDQHNLSLMPIAGSVRNTTDWSI